MTEPKAIFWAHTCPVQNDGLCRARVSHFVLEISNMDPLDLLSHCRLTLFCWGGRRRIAMIRYQFNGTYTHANIYNRHWKLQKPLWIFHPNWLGHPASLALNFMVLHCTWLTISSQEPCFTIFYASPSSRVSFSSGPRPLAYSPLRAPSIRSEICWRAWS